MMGGGKAATEHAEGSVPGCVGWRGIGTEQVVAGGSVKAGGQGSGGTEVCGGRTEQEHTGEKA